MASAIFAPIAAAAAKYGARYAAAEGAKALGNTIGTFAAGKQGESIGSYNEGASDKLRELSRKYNVPLEELANATAKTDENAANNQSARDMKTAAFTNQMNRATERADTVNKMTQQDQMIAADQASQLANSYQNAAARQAQASANVMNAFGLR